VRATVDVMVFPGDDAELQVMFTTQGPTVRVGDVNVTWLGEDGARRAVKTLRRLADSIEAGR
jgi:hypothetical protein